MRECTHLGCDRVLEHRSTELCGFHHKRLKTGIPLDAPWGFRRGRPPTFDWAACGTTAQYKKHLNHGIPTCRACRDAENRYNHDKYHNFNAGNPPLKWTITEDEILMSGISLKEAALRLGRSYMSVKNRRDRLRKFEKITSQSLIGRAKFGDKLEIKNESPARLAG
ncbi:HNH homing endonuclease [Mycobacterium phage WXIN]|nr:HNH homing endonuclease [Mycobacterium phage WXIN]